ncbi:ubiquinol-cytochrome c reductase iron-sulfur subunit [Acetobacteraceae bacterium ESL0709]|nr:ubiquinol-cytochrome c reductase iron-sulfur subunit [Acetobacteraceae bacterium ESL0697]MDF7678794.1 ubiquinol-cytochrome c reductase iron-sulfur subunit [Acetobacteraceae bacterium ESL0709]
MSPKTPHNEPSDTPTSPTRRQVLTASTVALGGAGACTLAVPFIESLRGPEASLQQAGESEQAAFLDVDLSDLKPGDYKQVVWKRWPVFILHRTPEMMKLLTDPVLRARLSDPDSKICQQPKDAVNDYRSINPAYAILIGICTHLGCVPKFSDSRIPFLKGGLFCPCHGSEYDNAGRVLTAMPAPYNLPVPPARFVNPTTLRLGESAGDPHFTMNDIRQL